MSKPPSPVVRALIEAERDAKEQALKALCGNIGVEYAPAEFWPRVRMLIEIGLLLAHERPEFKDTVKPKRKPGRPRQVRTKAMIRAEFAEEAKAILLERHGKRVSNHWLAKWLVETGRDAADEFTIARDMSAARRKRSLVGK